VGNGRHVPSRPWFILVLGRARAIDSAVAWTVDGGGGGTVDFFKRHGDMRVV